MNSLQKQAWLTVIMAAISFIAYLALGPVVGFGHALGAFGLFGITGLGPLFWRTKCERLDERDRAIFRRASLIAFAVSYLVFVVGCMGTFSILYSFQQREQVSILVLPLITGAGGFAFFLTQAIATLILYRIKLEADHG